MNKTAIKKFAIEARKKLMASVVDRAGFLGITPEECREPINTGAGFAVFQTTAGTETTLYGDEIKYRKQLVNEIKQRGFEAVIEEVAYTWFNRIIAIHFMEVNDYLPTRVRVLSSEKEGKVEPDLLTLAPDVDIEFTEQEREYILTAKSENKLDELFRMLFIKQCQELHKILPELFEKTNDYTEMLLNISFTNKDDVVRMLVDEVEEENFDLNARDEEGNSIGQVEIIGWLYQYYNTELKDDTFAKLKKNIKITKERIPAATQLFTPDWIVRYMVENSLGRLWIEHLRANDETIDEKETVERFGWKYYLPEAEQEEKVNIQLVEVRTSYKDLKPTDILCIDPCMGSGHILIYMFDVLMDIYKSVGYSERDAAFEIVEHNIHGLDIDKRAYQLAYFAVMMKGRGYNRRFFRGREVSGESNAYNRTVRPKLCAIQESNLLPVNIVQQFKENFEEFFTENDLACLEYVQELFSDAREYGSILSVEDSNGRNDRQYLAVKEKIENLYLASYMYGEGISLNLIQTMLIKDVYSVLCELLRQAEVMSQKYDIVITNPPYMGTSNGDSKLSNYIKKNYPNTKTDLFAVFIERCQQLLKICGYQAMITQHAWMFLPSYEKLRDVLGRQMTLMNMVHLGTRAFDEISGEVVQTTSFVFQNGVINELLAKYVRLVEYQGEKEKSSAFLKNKDIFLSKYSKFSIIPNKVLAYWISDNFRNIFNNKSLKHYGDSCIGMRTGDNARFLRLWFEVDFRKIGLNYKDAEEAKKSKKKWFPYCKGGSFRKWYGNNDYVVNWENDGFEIKENTKRIYPQLGDNLSWKISNEHYYFKPGLTWSGVGASVFGVRSYPQGMIFDSGANSFFTKSEELYYYFAGLMNCNIIDRIIKVINPTINTGCGVVALLPALVNTDYLEEVTEIVNENINISKTDWNSFETSWEFNKHPFIIPVNRISDAFELWEKHCEELFEKLKRNEERLNVIFSRIFSVENEIKYEVPNNLITVSKADITRDIKSFLSYVIGCKLGRYGLDMNIIEGQNECTRKEEVIIPICELGNDDNDVIGCITEFLEEVYGEEQLEENLKYIADVLDEKGETSRQKIRNYFINSYYNDHCNTYSVCGSGKRPIYWLFDSGKENAFKALICMHHYNSDTVGRVRTEYLHKAQTAIENAIQTAQYTIDNATSATEKSKATKKLTKLTKQLAETRLYDQALAHVANQRLEIDLDDGVKVNYAKFQGIEVSQEGKKPVKIDLLAKIK